MRHALCSVVLILASVALVSPLQALSLPDVPLYEDKLYRGYERAIACGFAGWYPIGDRPISRENFVRLLGEISTFENEAAESIYADLIDYFERDLPLFGLESDVPGTPYFWEPVTTARTRLFSLNSPLDFRRLENSDGEALEDGLNLFLDASSRVQLTQYFSLFYQLQLNTNSENTLGSVKKGYAKFRWRNFALKAGRDSIWWGPGFRGAWVLSNNPREFDMVQLKSELPFRLPWVLSRLGEFGFDVAHLWLDDDRRVRRDPRMLVMRASYMPVSWFEIAANRATTYGGSGRPEYGGLTDWWEVISGVEDKLGGEFDNENFVGYEASLSMPFLRKLTRERLKGGRVYLDRATDDPVAPWQKGEDQFRFVLDSLLLGIYLTTGRTDFRFEYARSERITYRPDKYPAGYTYRRFIIGHPLGPDGRGIYLELYRRFSNRFHALAFYNDEAHGIKLEGDEEKVREVGVDLTYKLNFMGEKIELEGGGVFSRIENLDRNTDPVRFDISNQDKDEWFAHLGVTWRW
jgi:hypothetical protein